MGAFTPVIVPGPSLGPSAWSLGRSGGLARGNTILSLDGACMFWLLLRCGQYAGAFCASDVHGVHLKTQIPTRPVESDLRDRDKY